ncbi:MAG: class I SAM-dependent methyltransferase [Candidatus Magnetoovum sp. WYHC-5]|nr:class I SAM-dependent methyltransferase [Candidatus Magnetoovum sp. WYHC-5]
MGKSKQFILYYRAVKAFLFFVSRLFIRLNDSYIKKPIPVDNVNMDTVKTKMFNFWQKELHASEKTCEDWINYALNYQHYQSVLKDIKQKLGNLKGLRVLDAGCGWGTLSVLLQKEGVSLTFIDHFDVHVEVTKERLGDGEGFCCDLRNMQGVLKDDSYDLIIAHAVIEHIGSFGNNGYRGDASSSLNDKLMFVKELHRVLKPGGQVFMSTGNYNYPIDGEVNVCCFHWLPDKYQREILKDIALNADNYGLLKWAQLEKLVLEAGLQISEIAKIDVKFFKNVVLLLAPIISVFIPNITPKLVDVVLHMLENDPNAMPAWNVFLTKPKG